MILYCITFDLADDFGASSSFLVSFYLKKNIFFVQSNAKVAVLGASGGIGQPLSLLLKNSHRVTHLSLYDVMHTPGVAADLSHISTKAKVTGHLGSDQLADAVKGADLVLIPAGVPRKPGIKLFI